MASSAIATTLAAALDRAVAAALGTTVVAALGTTVALALAVSRWRRLQDKENTLQDKENTPMIRRVAIIGLGPHNRRIYYPQLERRSIVVALVIDIEGQRESVEGFLQGRRLQPEQVVYIPTEARDDPTMHPTAAAALQAARDRFDGIIISSEPSSHQPYLRWALEHGVPALIDKPPIIPAPFALTAEAAKRIIIEFDEVLALAEASPASVAVTVQRRAHPGYKFVHEYVSEFVAQHGVPISYIDIYHADGMWCMPGELSTRTYHPYRHGYGKLCHSGYHFLDLLMWFNSINEACCAHKAAHTFEVYCRRFGAEDQLHQHTDADLARLTKASDAQLRDSREQTAADLSALGELNFHSLLQFFRGAAVVTQATHSRLGSAAHEATSGPPRRRVGAQLRHCRA